MLEKVAENWETDKLLRIIILLASYTTYMLPTSSAPFVVLRKCRTITCAWLQKIEKMKVVDAKDLDDLHARIFSIAMCVILSFDTHVVTSTFVPEDADAFLWALMTLYAHSTATQNKFRVKHTTESVSVIEGLVLKCHRIVLIKTQQLHNTIAQRPRLLTDFVERHFSGYMQNWISIGDWSPYQSEHCDYYFAVTQSNDVLQIGIVDGVFLINGSPRSRLPASIESNKLYKRVFGDHIFEVSNSQGEFKSSCGSWIFRELEGGLSVVQQIGGKKWKLLPYSLFTEEFQTQFVVKYSHWYSASEQVVEFRTVCFNDPKFSEPSYRADLESHSVLDIHSNQLLICKNSVLFNELMVTFGRLDQSKNVHMSKIRDGGAIKVSLVQMGLDFVASSSTVESVQCSGCSVDPDQYPKIM